MTQKRKRKLHAKLQKDKEKAEWVKNEMEEAETVKTEREQAEQVNDEMEELLGSRMKRSRPVDKERKERG